MAITVSSFGKTKDGKEVMLYKLTNGNGITAEITNFGGVVVSLWVPDRNGKLEDVVLGFDTLEEYEQKGPYFGALIGRCANRTEDAQLEWNGITYKLLANDGPNHLHGGAVGFDKVVWEPEVIVRDGVESLQLSYFSRDGEEGYPGNLNAKVIYSLTDDNALVIGYEAVTDRDTVVNLTNHSYFNLSGHSSGNIENHQMLIHADAFTPMDGESIPTGEIRDVRGTPMDFTALTTIGPGLHSEYEQVVVGRGYDHNWVLNVSGKQREKAAEVYDPSSGRVMEVYTTKPGVQFYSGNYLDGTRIGKGGTAYPTRAGLCLETQYFPNALKHKHFPSSILRAGEIYRHETSYHFSNR